ncbi:cardiolipin synthase [Pseudalkalibacillus berkeleyi]|uniref:Cardiolipin synthase n=1 Tax=Pseudalkalibacillus berkeleyi TaxID=1069813 RepID=A0ABS9H1T4_9BACL|nr:cardiolipin synthase [Pseudalkalibacillus berkeleyi]MCF6138943.1 cardiolipin synthase [Pseudalkalibacillus berkeleyi]
MDILFIIFLSLAIITILAVVDFYLGRKAHINASNRLMLPPEKGDWDFYSEGTTFFKQLFEDLKRAESFIYVQFYIVRDDPIGQELFQILKKKASEGVTVFLVVDAVGSHQLPKKVVEHLRTSGVQVYEIEKPKFPFFFYSLNRRNHRKISVIDGHYAYIGGYNVGVEYLGKDPKFGHWRDYHLRLHGKVVAHFHKLIHWELQQATKQTVELSFPEVQDQGTDDFGLLATNGEHIEDFFLKKISEAKQSIFIGSPYFIPGRKITQALKAACQNGVKVQILIPLRADHPFVKEAAIPFLLPLLHAGAEIYRYYPGFYHAKVFMIDKRFCDIGTANFDKRSFYLNNEVNCLFTSEKLIESIRKVVDFDLRQSEQLTLPDLTKRSLLERTKGLFANTISRFL